jgi:hypothetical protein
MMPGMTIAIALGAIVALSGWVYAVGKVVELMSRSR